MMIVLIIIQIYVTQIQRLYALYIVYVYIVRKNKLFSIMNNYKKKYLKNMLEMNLTPMCIIKSNDVLSM